MNTQTLVMLAELYCEHTGLKLATVSTYAENDGKFFGSLKAGKAGCTIRRAERVVRWFDSHWPKDLEWPPHIQRPTPERGAA